MSSSCGCLSPVTSSTLMSPNGQHPTWLLCCAWGCHHSDARLGLPSARGCCAQLCQCTVSVTGGGNLSVTGLTTAVLGQRPVLPQGVCSASLVEGLQMLLAM